MHPQYEAGKEPAGKCYTDIEGGLGWWRDTHFPTTTPKFIMGGVGPNFSFIANGPGYGNGTWEKPKGQYGVAQLSPWLLFPLDGLNPQTRHERRTLRIWLSSFAADESEGSYRRQKRAHR
jgi:hypothetical protein